MLGLTFERLMVNARLTERLWGAHGHFCLQPAALPRCCPQRVPLVRAIWSPAQREIDAGLFVYFIACGRDCLLQEVRSSVKRSGGGGKEKKSRCDCFFIRNSSFPCRWRCSQGAARWRMPPVPPEDPCSRWKLEKRKEKNNVHALCNGSRAVTVCDLQFWTPLILILTPHTASLNDVMF